MADQGKRNQMDKLRLQKNATIMVAFPTLRSNLTGTIITANLSMKGNF